MNPIDRCIVADTETTGLDTKTCKIVEVGLVGSFIEFETLVNPGCEIPPDVSAIHHICDEDVVGEPRWNEALAMVLNAIQYVHEETGHLPVLVAHNAQYDKEVLKLEVPVLWICTYKCALRVWPDAPSHKNEVLRYWLKLGNSRGRKAGQFSHSALHDAKVTRLVLEELFKHATLEQMVEWTEQPAKLPKMPMGKHYGQAWDTVPASYLQWCINQADMREDVKYCAKEELERRRSQHATHRSS